MLPVRIAFKLSLFIIVAILAFASPAPAQKATNPSPADGAIDVRVPLTFSWTAVPGAQGYYLTYAKVPGGETVQLFTNTTSLAPINNNYVWWESSYVWRIDVQTSEGITTGDLWYFDTLDRPDMPVNLSPAHNATGVPSEYTFEWEAAARAESYLLTIEQTGTPFFVGDVGNVTSHTVTNFVPAIYTWNVTAINPAGQQVGPTWSFSTHFVTPPAVPTYTAPANASTGHERSLRLKWNVTERSTGYDVFLGDSLGNMLKVADLPGDTLEYVATGLEASKTYHWRVEAKNNIGSTAGPNWSFTTTSDASYLDIGDAKQGLGFSIPPHTQTTVDQQSISPYEKMSIAAPGDINGDGFDDLLVGYPSAFWGIYRYRGIEEDDGRRVVTTPSYLGYRGKLSVHFGRQQWGSTVPESPAHPQGFSLDGPFTYPAFGWGLSSIGDINGDGFYDFAMQNYNYIANNPRTILLRGQTDYSSVTSSKLPDITIATLNFDGAVAVGNIDGIDATDMVAFSDGYTGVPGARPQLNLQALFGNFTRFQTNIGTLSTLDQKIVENIAIGKGRGAGDVNGDGISDLLIKPAIDANKPGYIIYGTRTFKTQSWQLDSLNGTNGFRIQVNGATGAEVDFSSIGDFNGDGYADILHVRASQAFIIRGRSTFPALLNPETDANTIKINPGNSTFIPQAMPLGDINGDGLADIALSTVDGRSYIIRGNESFATPYDVTAATAGPRVHSPYDFMWLMHAGDLNGDGVGDFIVVACDNLEGKARELAWVRAASVFFGQRVQAPMKARAFASAGDSRQTGVGETNDENPIPVTRVWMNFEDGAAPGGGTSTIDVIVHRGTLPLSGLFTSPKANVAWKVETNRQDWTFASMTLRYHDADVAGITTQKLRAYIAPTANGPWRIAENQFLMPHIHMIRLQITGADFTNGVAWVTFGPTVAPGDVNMDGTVDAGDVVAARQVIAGERTHPDSIRAADLTPTGGDGSVTENDVLAIIKLITGK